MGDASWSLSTDLTQRVPGHSLIDELLRQWDRGTIRVDDTGTVVIDDEVRGWYLGVLGERRVALELLRLGPEWTVLHSVPVGRGDSDIDHVIIGPGGVFTINTKHSPGKDVWYAGLNLMVGGIRQPYLRNAVFEARQARAKLSAAAGSPVAVTGILAFVDPSKIASRAPAGEGDVPILVVPHSALSRVFQRAPVITSEHVARIVAAASDPKTWHDRPVTSSLGTHVTKEFLALEEVLGRLDLAERYAPPTVRALTELAPTPAASSRPPRKRSTAAYSAGRSRPPVRRNRSRRRRRSALDRLIWDLIVPVVGLIVGYNVLMSFVNR